MSAIKKRAGLIAAILMVASQLLPAYCHSDGIQIWTFAENDIPGIAGIFTLVVAWMVVVAWRKMPAKPNSKGIFALLMLVVATLGQALLQVQAFHAGFPVGAVAQTLALFVLFLGHCEKKAQCHRANSS